MFSNPLGHILKDFFVRDLLCGTKHANTYIPFQVNYKIQNLCVGSVSIKCEKKRNAMKRLLKWQMALLVAADAVG